MRARKRLAALLVAGALSAPMLTPAPASAQSLLDLNGLLGGTGTLGGLLGGTGGLLGTTGGTGGLTGVLGSGLLNSLLQGSTLLNDCALALGVLDPATCLAASQIPTTTTTNPFGGFGGFPTGGFGGFPTGGFGGFPQFSSLPIARTSQPLVITNNNASNSTSSAVASVAPGGGATASATGNSGSTQNQTIVIP